MICKQGKSKFILKLYLVSSRSDPAREQDHLSPHAPADQELSGGDSNLSAEEVKSCNSENCHAANPVSSGYIIKETAN